MAINQPYEEKELLIRIAEGDEKAFSILINQYSATVYSHCLAYLKSVTGAEELTQDIFVQIWQIREKLPQVDSFADYLFIISKHTIFRSFRKKVQELVLLTDEHQLNNALQPDLQAEYKNHYELLMQGIQLLPEKRRRAFELSRLEGKTHAEIADIMGINKITVAQYIMLALDFLRRFMQQHGVQLALLLMPFLKKD